MSQRLKQHLLNVHKAISPSSYKQITLNLYKSIRKSKSPVLLRKMNLRSLTINGTPDSSNAFWEQYYIQNDVKPIQEWYCNVDVIKNFLPEADSMKNILILGNGLSKLPLDLLVDDDYPNCQIASTDISQTSIDAIDQLAKQTLSSDQRSRLSLLAIDLCEMEYTEKFDLVLEKGFIDSFWKSSNEPDITKLKIIESKVHRSLISNGQWIILSLYDLTETGFLDQPSKSLWTSIQDTTFRYTPTNQDIRVYKLTK